MAVTFLEEAQKGQGVTFLEDEAPEPLTAGISGSEPIAPRETPVMSETDPRFPEAAQAVNTGLQTAEAFTRPFAVDLSAAVPGEERGRQLKAVEIERRLAQDRVHELSGVHPASVEERVSAAQNLSALMRKERGLRAIQDELHAQSPEGQREALANVMGPLYEKYHGSAEGGAPGLAATGFAKVAEGVLGMSAAAGEALGMSDAAQAMRADMAGFERVAEQTKGHGAEVVRGLAGLVPLIAGLPEGKAGAAQAAVRAAAESYSSTLNQTGDTTAAYDAAVQTAPEMAAFMLGGAVAGKGVAAMLPKDARAVTVGLANLAGAEIANVGVSNVLAALHGQDYGLANFSADTLLALYHGTHGYKDRVGEVERQRAAEKLKSYGWSEEQIKAPYDGPSETPAFQIIKPTEEPTDAIQNRSSAPPDGDVLNRQGTPEGAGPLPAEVSGAGVSPRRQGEGLAPEPRGPTPQEVEPTRNLGPGAANIEEFGPSKPIGAYNAAVDQQRTERGLPPLMSEARQSDPVTWEKTEQRIEADAEYPVRLVDDINAGKKSSVSDVEQSALLWRMIDLRNRRETELERATNPESTPEEQEQAKLEYDSLGEQLSKTEEADRKSGTMQGRALRIRRLLVNEDFTVAGLMRRAELSKGQPLTEQERTKIKAQSEGIQATEKAFQDRTAKLEEEQAGGDVDAAIRDIETEARKNPEFTPEVLSLADRIVARLDTAASAALKRLRSKFAQANVGADPTILADVVIYGSAKLAKGAVKFSTWAAGMVRDFGEAVKPYLEEAWKAIDKGIDEAVAAAVPDKAKRAKVKAAVTKEGAADAVAAIGEGMKERVKSGEKLTNLRGDIQKLVESLVRGGIKQRDPLIDAVHEVLKGVDPAITRRQTMDAISGYGNFKPLNQDAVKAEVRDLRGQMQQVAKIEDILSKKPLQKTGMERRTPSDEERALIKQVNELAKQHGIVVTDPATQLKTALGAIETRLTNRIRDLKAEISAGTRAVKTKTSPPTNEKIEVLRKELAALEAEHEKVFGKRQMTPEQKLAGAVASAKRAEAAEQTRLEKAKRGIFDRPIKNPAMRSAELDAIKARTEAAREERKALETAANPPLSDAQKRLDAALVAKERWQQVLAGEIAPAKKLPREALTQLEEDARAEIAAMRELAAEIRRDSKPKTDPEIAKENAQVKALEKAAAEYEKRLNDADFAGRGKKLGPDTTRVAAARALRDAARKAFDAAKDATKPKRTDEEIALQSIKAQLARRNADLADRLAKGDFAKRPARKPLDISKDPQAVKLKAENDRLKREFNQQREKWRLAQRSAGKKFLDTAADLIGSSRTLITSADVSAPFRQGAVFSIGDLVFNPVRFGRQLRRMFGSLASENQFQKSETALRLRPNADLYDSSGLYLSDIDGKFTNREETMRSNLAEKVPLVRRSNRAYADFLNQQRADAFDSFVDMMGGKDKVTKDQAEFLASAVNELTGRGGIKGSHVGAANLLARFLFSPRFLISRFKVLVGEPIWRGIISGPAVGAKARAIVALQYGKFAAGLGVLYGLAAMAGGKVEKDRRSTDFGKIRFGSTRVDPMGGLQQLAVLLSRGLSGKTKDLSGNVKPVKFDTLGNFVRGKLAPIPGAAVDLTFGGGKNVVGEKVTPLSTLKRLTIPISYDDLPAVYREHGAAKATVLEVLNLLGMGLQQHRK